MSKNTSWKWQIHLRWPRPICWDGHDWVWNGSHPRGWCSNVILCSCTQEHCTSISPVAYQSHMKQLHFQGGPLDPMSQGDVSEDTQQTTWRTKGKVYQFLLLSILLLFLLFLLLSVVRITLAAAVCVVFLVRVILMMMLEMKRRDKR